MSTVRAQGRFHIVFIVKYIRYGLILCLVPMLKALIKFDLPSLATALRQDAAILIGMALFSFFIWRAAASYSPIASSPCAVAFCGTASR